MWIYAVGLGILFVLYRTLKKRHWVNGLHRKCVFITGCDSGFGRALAKSLYERGVPVFAGCYTQDGAESLKQETGERLQTLIVDISKTDSIRQAEKFVREHLPPNSELWGIVNNAGIPGPGGPMEFLSRKDFADVMSVNLYGMIDVTNAFLHILKKSQGRIVNMASIAAEIAVPRVGPYCCSKYAAKGYSECLRRELILWGIKVAVIEPAFFNTNIVNFEVNKKSVLSQWEHLSPSIKEEYGEGYVEEAIAAMKTVTQSIEHDLSIVIRDYEHALFARHADAVYYPGKWAKLFHILPPFAVDILLARYPVPLPKVLAKSR